MGEAVVEQFDTFTVDIPLLSKTHKSYYKAYMFLKTGLLYCTKCGELLEFDKFGSKKECIPFYKRSQCLDCENKTRGFSYRNESLTSKRYANDGIPNTLFNDFEVLHQDDAKHLPKSQKTYYRLYMFLKEKLLYCGKCNKLLDIDKFRLDDKKVLFGRRTYCHACELKYSRSTNVKEKRSNNHKLKYVENRDHILEYQEEYRQNNKEKISKRNKKYRKENKDKIKEWQSEYYNENRDERIKYVIGYTKKRRKKDPYFRMKLIYRKQLWRVFAGEEREIRSKELLGCSYEEFLEYLELPEGKEYTDFELDHVIPIEAFNICEDSEKILCSHYTNFQLLSKRDNRSKSDFWEGIRWRDVSPEDKKSARLEILNKIKRGAINNDKNPVVAR
jgi:hypothetical protein